jgi:hypothetical protein
MMLAHYFISALCIFIGIILLQTLAKEKPAANRNRLITSLIQYPSKAELHH